MICFSRTHQAELKITSKQSTLTVKGIFTFNNFSVFIILEIVAQEWWWKWF